MRKAKRVLYVVECVYPDPTIGVVPQSRHAYRYAVAAEDARQGVQRTVRSVADTRVTRYVPAEEERARIAGIIREEIEAYRALLAEDSASMTRTTIDRIRIDALEGLLEKVEASEP